MPATIAGFAGGTSAGYPHEILKPQKPMQTTTSAVALLPTAFLSFLASATAQQQLGYVEVSTDTYEAAPGVLVRATQGTSYWDLMTGRNGCTEEFPLAPGVSAEYTLGETAVSGGILIGQRLTATTLPGSTSVERRDQIWLTQPLAITTYVDSSAPSDSGGEHTRWMIVPADANSRYGFTGHVASLAVDQEMDAYFAYNYLVPAVSYDTGILIRYDGEATNADLTGAVLLVDTQALSVAATPDVHTYLVAQVPGNAGTSTLSGQYVGTELGYHKIALVGHLGKGDNLIMLAGNGGGSVGPTGMLASPGPMVAPTPPPAGSPPGGSGGSCTDCDVSKCYGAAPTFNCPWTLPSGDEDCPSPWWRSGMTEGYGLWTGPELCDDGSGGASVTVEKGTVVKHSVKRETNVTLNVSGNVLGAEGSATFNNTVTKEYSWETRNLVQYQKGIESNPVTDDGVVTTQGCGECLHQFQWSYAAERDYTYYYDWWFGCHPMEGKRVCRGTGPLKSASCSRETGTCTSNN